MTVWTVAIIAVVALAAWRVLRPLTGPAEPWDTEEDLELERLLAAKNQVLRALKDLQHEYEAGFLDEPEYQETRREYLEEAARLNRQVAAMTGVDPAG